MIFNASLRCLSIYKTFSLFLLSSLAQVEAVVQEVVVYQVKCIKCTIFGEGSTVIYNFAAAESICGVGAVSELLGQVLLPFDVVCVPW